MSARRKSAGRKSGTSRTKDGTTRSARKKAAAKKGVKKKVAAKKKSLRRTAASKKTAPGRKLELVRRSGTARPSAGSRTRPKLGLVRGGKTVATDRERRQAGIDEALAEDVAKLPKAAEASSPSRSFQQTDVATSKQMVLFRMARARTSVLAALQGLQAGSADRPLGEKRWSVRQMVLHLSGWDARVTEAVEPAIAGVPPQWAGYGKKDFDRLNGEAVERFAHLSWDDALRQLHTARQELLAAIEGIPDEPMHVWGEEHALGGMLNWVAPHDLHHADIVKRWRAREGV